MRHDVKGRSMMQELRTMDYYYFYLNFLTGMGLHSGHYIKKKLEFRTTLIFNIYFISLISYF